MSRRPQTKAALDKYLTKQLNQERKPKRKNQKPEKELVAKMIIWLQAHGFSCHVIESKAVWNESAGRYLQGQTVPGMPDIVGNDAAGRAVYIEVKAPGRRSTLKQHQRDFLAKKILTNCFAVCVDSIDDLAIIYTRWIETNGTSEKITLLAEFLPKERQGQSGIEEKRLFD